MSKQRAQAAIFGIIALSFILPFVNVSCSADEEYMRNVMRSLALEQAEEELPTQEFTGWDLVSGRARLAKGVEDFAGSGDEAPEEEVDDEATDVLDDFRLPAEPFAQIALAAAIAGVAFARSKSPTRRYGAGAACAAAVAASLWLLTTSPSLRKLGVLTIEPAIGYWIAMTLSVLTGFWLLGEWRHERAAPEQHAQETSPASRSATGGPTLGERPRKGNFT